jgi:hypothetical protein
MNKISSFLRLGIALSKASMKSRLISDGTIVYLINSLGSVALRSSRPRK